MDDRSIGLYLSRILSGYYFVYIDTNTYKIIYPNTQLKYKAEIYADIEYEKNKFNDWITEEDTIYFLIEMGLWSIDGDSKLKSLEKEIENLKIELYLSLLNPTKQKTIRRQLIANKKLYETRYATKHLLDNITTEGFCNYLKNQYILINTIYDQDDKLVFNDSNNIDYNLLNNIISAIHHNAIEISIFKKIARSDLWRNYWNANSNNLFGKPTIEWTDEQKTLVVLTKMYDSAYENSECPEDSVFEDDDMFEGWMISQRRENEKNRSKRRSDKILDNKKLGNAQEVFLVANSKEEAKNIYDLNDDNSKHVIKEREQAIVKNKSLQDLQLPDIQRDRLVESNQQFMQMHRKK